MTCISELPSYRMPHRPNIRAAHKLLHTNAHDGVVWHKSVEWHMVSRIVHDCQHCPNS